MNVKVANMTTNSLGLTKADIDSIANADLAQGTKAANTFMENIDKALETVNTNRAKFRSNSK